MNMAEGLERLTDIFRSEKKVAVFMGAGASVFLGIDDWQKLLQSISDRFSLKDKINIEEDIENEIKYSMIASKIYNLITNKEEYKTFLSSKFIPKKGFHYSLHLKILTLFNLILTVNYDTSFEEAYTDLKYFSMKHDLNLNDLIIHKLPDFSFEETNNQQVFVYLHGNNEKKEYILLQEEYEAFYPHNYNENNNESSLESYLKYIITNFHIIFIGFSFNDEDFVQYYEYVNRSYKIQRQIEFESLGRDELISLPSDYVFIIKEDYYFKVEYEEMRKILENDSSIDTDIFKEIETNFTIFSDEASALINSMGNIPEDLSKLYDKSKRKEKLRYKNKDLNLNLILYDEHTEVEDLLLKLIKNKSSKKRLVNDIEDARNA